MEMSLVGSRLVIGILYESNAIRSMMASVSGLSFPPSFSYHSSSLYCEQKIVDECLRRLWMSSNRFDESSSLILIRSHSSRMSKVGFVYFFSVSEKCPSSLAARRSKKDNGARPQCRQPKVNLRFVTRRMISQRWRKN